MVMLHFYNIYHGITIVFIHICHSNSMFCVTFHYHNFMNISDIMTMFLWHLPIYYHVFMDICHGIIIFCDSYHSNTTFLPCFWDMVILHFGHLKYQNSSAVKRLSVINRIQNNSFWLHTICVYCVYLLCYEYISEKLYVHILNILNIYIYLFMWQHWRNYTLLQCKVVSVQLV